MDYNQNSEPMKSNNRNRFGSFHLLALGFSILTCASLAAIGGLGYSKTVSLEKTYESAIALPSIKSDYSIPGLSLDQIDEIKKRSDVTGVLPYYSYVDTVSNGSKSFLTYVNFLDNISNMDMTAFMDKRVISHGDTSGLSIFVDKTLAKQFGCSVGDFLNIPIGSTTFAYRVAAVAETNYVDDEGVALASISDDVKAAIKSAYISYGDFHYSSSYISCSDKSSFYGYIKDYLPEAERLPREAFSSNTEYQIYITKFENTNNAGRIIDIKDTVTRNNISTASVLEKEKSNTVLLSILSSVVPVVLSILAIVLYHFDLRKYHFSSSDYKPEMKFQMIVGGGEVAVSIIVGLAISAVFAHSFSVAFADAFKSILIPFVLGISISLLFTGAKCLAIRKIIKKK